MKKLLITTMAAVSVGLCAKADDTKFISGTSFETLAETNYLATKGEQTLCKWYNAAGIELSDDKSADPELGSRYWMTEATDAQFVVSNLNKFAGAYLSNANRPQKWSSDENSKALYIDTDKPLMRYVYRSVDDRHAKGADLTQDIFFDSVVQFTATDVAAEPDSKDKLRVWLYASPEDSEGRLFNETQPITNLVITAGYYDNDGNKVSTNYLTNVSIQPDTWHRLTIKAINDIGTPSFTPGFEVYVDGDSNPVSGKCDYVGENPILVTKFPSLLYGNINGVNSLQCVAFDGKGAVDDIVFTTTVPEFAKEPEAEKYAFTLNFSENVEIYSLEIGGEKQTSVSSGSSYDVEVGKLIYLNVLPKDGYTLTFEGGTFGSDGFGGYEYSFTPSAAGSGTITITAVSTGGGSGEESEDPAKPTIGGNAVDNAGAFIAAANSGVTIKVPTDWTLDGNTLKDAAGKEYATFADYYTATLATDGTVTLELNDNAEPTIDETVADKGDAIVVTDAAVALGVTNAKVGLWYGAQAYSDAACTMKIGDEPTGWVQADGETVTVTATKPEGDKAFFKVVVDDQDHTPPAEGQE